MRAALVLLGVSTLLLLAAIATAQDAKLKAAKVEDVSIDEVDKTPVEAKFAPNGRIRLALCPSEAHIVGSDDGILRVSYRATNDRDDVRVRIDVTGDRAEVRTSGCPHNNFQITVEVPKSSGLHVRMFAGDLSVEGVDGDKDVEVHAGHLTIDVGKPDNYARVDASVLTGDVEAPPFDVSKGGLFRSFEHSGPGKYRIHAHVGAGQIELR